MDETWDSYPKKWALGMNAMIIAMLTVAAWGMRGLWVGYVSILYVVVFLVMTVFVLRKLICTNCYYYGKWCNTGWGKLAAKMFKKDTGNTKLGGALAMFNWMVWFTLLPIATMGYVLFTAFSFYELAFLVLFLALVIVQQMVRNVGCGRCKEKKTCTGSKYKEKK